MSILEYEELDSTNDEAKRLVRAALAETAKPVGLYGAVVTARRQTAGKGRLGKGFVSPSGDSVYASFILEPPERPAEQRLTAFAAVAVCEAIEKTTSYKTYIKWINDIIVDGKKVCGILAESIPRAVILGIGVNINLGAEDLPPELRDTAGSIHMDAGTRTLFFNALAEAVFRCTAAGTPPADTTDLDAGIVSPQQSRYIETKKTDAAEPGASLLPTQDTRQKETRAGIDPRALYADKLMEAYRARSILIGRHIILQRGNEKRLAFATGIADDGALIVEYEDGAVEHLRTSDISVRLAP